MDRKLPVVFLSILFLVGIGATQGITDGAGEIIYGTADTITDLISGDDSSSQESAKSHSSSTKVIPPEEFPVNPDAKANYNEGLWLTVMDDVQTRATVKLWGDVENFKDYRCYAVVSDEKFYENGDEKAILTPDVAEAEDDYSGQDFNDNNNQKDTVIEIELNSLGEARIRAPDSVSKEVEDSYFDTGLWGNSKLADEGTYLQTQCFKENTATNMVFTTVGKKAYATDINEDGEKVIENLDNLQHRYYLPDGSYSLGFVSSGKGDYRNKYRFEGIEAQSCNMNFENGVSGTKSGSVVIQNNNEYPVKVYANFRLEDDEDSSRSAGLGSGVNWIAPNSEKELSFEDPLPIDLGKLPGFATGDQISYNAKIGPSWTGSGGGNCKVSCSASGNLGSLGDPVNVYGNSCDSGQSSYRSYWEQRCNEGVYGEEGFDLEENPYVSRQKCISDIADACIGADGEQEESTNTEEQAGSDECRDLMSSMCGDLYGNDELNPETLRCAGGS